MQSNNGEEKKVEGGWERRQRTRSSLSSLGRGLCTLNWVSVTDSTSWRVLEYLFGEGSSHSAHISTPVSWHLWHQPMYFPIIRGSLFPPVGFISFHVFMEFVLTYTLFLSALSNCFFPLATFPVSLYIRMMSLKQAANNLGEKTAVKQRVDLSVT